MYPIVVGFFVCREKKTIRHEVETNSDRARGEPLEPGQAGQVGPSLKTRQKKKQKRTVDWLLAVSVPMNA